MQKTIADLEKADITLDDLDRSVDKISTILAAVFNDMLKSNVTPPNDVLHRSSLVTYTIVGWVFNTAKFHLNDFNEREDDAIEVDNEKGARIVIAILTKTLMKDQIVSATGQLIKFRCLV